MRFPVEFSTGVASIIIIVIINNNFGQRVFDFTCLSQGGASLKRTC
jgi:hypothetical protein